MRLFKPKGTTPSGASNARLSDDGYQDAKAGKTPLSDQLFESKVDFLIYMTGYDKGVGERQPPKSRRPYLSCPASG